MSEGIPTYEWRTAPDHLRTRRQLAAEGLRPNGQDIAGRITRSRGSRKEPLVAHLFDVAKAAPKRQPSEAQRTALAKATRARQLRAAERRGVEIDQVPGDPGPAWTTNESVNAFSTTPVNAFAAVAEHEREEEMER
ncbi:RRQRL motif-containing zinc-binding protein [Nocardia mangyaensis]|uniref:RRQRL motif-containing zinc-binding protein n=1 Tax=Nocardia mangyaensis TaxID=2213200 RepID=UPI00267467E9|nr:RRQRL motif-containing zinc-binding protein [Nocardia mangyaensis]MDO3648661.1 RRQRL motif-containing zinc-binding protein [Nocardia mangyaensis]